MQDEQKEFVPTRAAQRLAAGKARRQTAPRASHTELGVTGHRRDPLALLERSNQGRIETLVPVRHSRMLESPFAFFRGSAVIQAADLVHTPRSGVIVQACGDCHLMNFGGFATPERNLAFDINDFDEAFPAPWEWDLKRLSVSLVLAARWRQFQPSVAKDAISAAVQRYRNKMHEYAAMSTLSVWYSRVTMADILDSAGKDRQVLRRVEAAIHKAQKATSEHVFHKLTVTSGGAPRIMDQPPLIYHPDTPELHRAMQSFLTRYAATLREDYRDLLGRFRYVDAAIKVVGVGSVGTRCFIVLMMGEHDDPLFLQIKEARASVLQEHTNCASPWKTEGERVVVGQRLMQAVSDIFLGWAHGPNTRSDYYVRQLRDMKVSADLSTVYPNALTAYGGLCGTALARAHAKAGHAAQIAGYIGSGRTFEEAIGQYAHDYADQVERDYESFRVAARTGRFQTETSSSSVEVMIS